MPGRIHIKNTLRQFTHQVSFLRTHPQNISRKIFLRNFRQIHELKYFINIPMLDLNLVQKIFDDVSLEPAPISQHLLYLAVGHGIHASTGHHKDPLNLRQVSL